MTPNEGGGGLREAWVFAPAGRTDTTIVAVRAEVARLCDAHSVTLREVKTTKRGEAFVVSGGDAQKLYTRMHELSVAVLSIQQKGESGPIICKRPVLTDLAQQDLWESLRHYCAHKAFFRRLRLGGDLAIWWRSFEDWIVHSECEGVHDPRCLPLHVFDAASGWRNRIRDGVGRVAFEKEYRSHSRERESRIGDTGLIDRSGFRWAQGKFHGAKNLRLCRSDLPPGFHWDVKVDNQRAKDLSTPFVTWRVKSYVNVTPDAVVRGQEPYAKKTKQAP